MISPLVVVIIIILVIIRRHESYTDPLPIYIISLPHRKDRLKRCVQSNGIKEYRVIEAVDGSNLQRVPPLTAGELGCFASHLHALRSIAHGPDAMALVLEDDAISRVPFHTLLRTISMPANADVLSLGCHWFPKNTPDPQQRIFPLNFDLYGAHAVIYSKEGARRILDRAPATPRLAYDIWLSRVPGIRKYVVWPAAVDIADVNDTDTQRIR